MAISQAEFYTARKSIENAILMNGDIKTAFQLMNKTEREALAKSMKIVADYFRQTHIVVTTVDANTLVK